LGGTQTTRDENTSKQREKKKKEKEKEKEKRKREQRAETEAVRHQKQGPDAIAATKMMD
jgi:hypothetical protein